MAKYPFLPQARRHIAELGIDINDLGELESIVNRAEVRIAATFEFLAHVQNQVPYKRSEVEIASFPVAILMVTGVKDKILTERYALSEARKIHSYLLKEKDEFILEIAESFEWDIHPSKQEPFSYTVHFVNYLNNATRGRLVHAPEWKLVNRQLDKGQVSVTRNEVCRLLQEEIKKYIEDRTKEKIMSIPQVIQDVIEEIKAEFLKRKPHLTEFDQKIRAEESEYPPCIMNLLDRTTKGQHLSHAERFTLVTYLFNQGISVDRIVNLFSNVADFREDKTRYQVEHLAGQRGSRTPYKTYNCSTLQTHGICVNPNDPVCKTIRNPLTYHLRKKTVEEKTQ
ncbi:MAG: DNA primase large subunit PriL [Candidatus Bathyarchaeota archaeon]|nr:DNA primase large subunit PriL [Candidatus Bathyarchaeota archaeon]MDH5494377.1 DNA primase large subunit PriL [Candidatus Bathyarchaeota archaeon]